MTACGLATRPTPKPSPPSPNVTEPSAAVPSTASATTTASLAAPSLAATGTASGTTASMPAQLRPTSSPPPPSTTDILAAGPGTASCTLVSSSRLACRHRQVRFMVDGQRIAPDDMAEEPGLENQGSLAGAGPASATSASSGVASVVLASSLPAAGTTSATSASSATTAGPLLMTVQSSLFGAVVVPVERESTVRQLIAVVSDIARVPCNRLLLCSQGQRLKPNDTIGLLIMLDLLRHGVDEPNVVKASVLDI